MVSSIQLAWAAGFMEGEGSFSNSAKSSAKVSAAQVQREPLERLQNIFGGKIRSRNTRGFSNNSIWVWALPARRSVEVMMTLYVLMSPRRKQQIETTLNHWKAHKRILRPHGSDTCGRGHALTTDNVYMNGRHRQCKECKRITKRISRDRVRSAA